MSGDTHVLSLVSTGRGTVAGGWEWQLLGCISGHVHMLLHHLGDEHFCFSFFFLY